jgi:hypothetical protein
MCACWVEGLGCRRDMTAAAAGCMDLIGRECVSVVGRTVFSTVGWLQEWIASVL